MADKTVPQVFTSPTYGRLDWEQALAKMVWFMGTDKNASYEVIIGTDSQACAGTADFVSALVVHKKGRGGIYFWSRQKVEKLYSMKQRIWQEAIISLNLAEKLVRDFAALGMFQYPKLALGGPDENTPNRRFGDPDELNLEIHVDIGPNGETREMISEIVGMIRANGFRVATKPASWGASHVADRHV